jgi:hypothetical protein
MATELRTDRKWEVPHARLPEHMTPEIGKCDPLDKSIDDTFVLLGSAGINEISGHSRQRDSP